ncbi:MAG: hypothetical protein NTV70_15940 [Acidobacteria bacterium]|nr:hypothetical protein [Acidobacteriota bacterium]
MRRRELLALPGVAALPAAAQSSLPLVDKQPGAGFAERDITPAIGSEQPGNYYKRYNESVHDPCKVRAAVFTDGAATAALVSVDALIVPRAMVLAARQRIAKMTSIAADAALIGATHTHSGGPVGMVQPGEFDGAPPHVQQLAKLSTEADPKYLTRVEDAIVDAVAEAFRARKAYQCGVASGIEEKSAFNRRFHMKNGQTWTHPQAGNPDMLDAAGPVDPEVGVMGAFDGGRLVGCVVTFACHATTNPAGISANWIYYLEKTIRAVHGPDVVVVFLPGATGDVTQVDNRSRFRQPTGEQWAKLVGGRVGAEALKCLVSMTPGALTPVRVASRTLDVARRKPSKARVAKAAALATPAVQTTAQWVFAKETVMLDWLISRYPTAPVEVQALQIGPVVFAANPSEYFCQLGLDIKKGSRFSFTWPVMLANGCVGYVPTEEAMGPGGGGYETRLTTYSNLRVTAGTEIKQVSLELIATFTPGATPAPPPHAPFKAPWDYGSVPPETS